MCGIIGFIAKSKESPNELFDLNYESILDRGKYFDKLELSNEIYGYVRLPTDAVKDRDIDVIQNVDNTYLLFNGLITNVDDLISLFSLSMDVAQSDTRSLHSGFARYQSKFLAKCRGMFAFAYITSESVTLVRDTIGIKPLYYINTEYFFGFCSEIKGLKHLINSQIHEVLPGEIITFNKKTKTVSKKKFVYESYKNYQKADLQECLIDSVVTPTERYLKQTSDKQVAVLLSGGIDSSLLLGLLARNLLAGEKRRIVAFNLGLTNSSDVVIADKLAKFLGITLVHVLPYAEIEVIEKIPQIVYTVESPHPRVVRVALLQDALAKKIQEMGIEIVISGEGADELFYGYERFITGLEREDIDELFSYFYNKVFCYTLLQRYERVFARHQIEGRVPFLDQELVELAKKFSVEEKIQQFANRIITKLPLRLLAKEINLPDYVCNRPKIKMTVGATMQTNEDNKNGYLEEYLQREKNKSFADFVQEIYRQEFFIQLDILANSYFLGSEEKAMEKVEQFRSKK